MISESQTQLAPADLIELCGTSAEIGPESLIPILQNVQAESCGKCTPCRVGTKKMLDILYRITEGNGNIDDLDTLEYLAWHIKNASLCGLGQTALISQTFATMQGSNRPVHAGCAWSMSPEHELRLRHVPLR